MRPMRSRPAWPPVTLTRTDWECFLAVSNEVGIIAVTLAGGSQATKIARYAQRPIKRRNDRRQLILGFTEFPAGWWIGRQGRRRSLFSPLIKPSPIDAQIETCDIALAAFCSETAGL